MSVENGYEKNMQIFMSTLTENDKLNIDTYIIQNKLIKAIT